MLTGNVDGSNAREVGIAFEAMLLKACLGSISGKDNSYASIAVDAFVREIATHDAHGFGAVLARRLDYHG